MRSAKSNQIMGVHPIIGGGGKFPKINNRGVHNKHRGDAQITGILIIGGPDY